MAGSTCGRGREAQDAREAVLQFSRAVSDVLATEDPGCFFCKSCEHPTLMSKKGTMQSTNLRHSSGWDAAGL